MRAGTKATRELLMTAKVVAVGPDRRWVPALMKMLPVPKPAAEPNASRMATSIMSARLRFYAVPSSSEAGP